MTEEGVQGLHRSGEGHLVIVEFWSLVMVTRILETGGMAHHAEPWGKYRGGQEAEGAGEMGV